MDIETFNRDWLKAWSAKDVDGVASFYTGDTTYQDAQVPGGLSGRDALKAYLTDLFAAVPPMTYEPETVWEIDGGYCGRWICTIDGPDGKSWLRGFDLCLLDDGRIAHNEVYVHQLAADPRK